MTLVLDEAKLPDLKKIARRAKKKRIKMKVGGKSVFGLQKIIRGK